MSRWTHAICEADWVEQRSTRDEDGYLLSIDRPVRLKDPEVEKCCLCGKPTIFGAYTREDPATLRCAGSPEWGPVHDDREEKPLKRGPGE